MAAAGRQDATGGASALNLFAPVSDPDATFCQASGTVSGWVFSENFTISIDPGTPSEEKILCSTIVGSSPATITFVERGYDDTTPTTHNAGAVITHVLPAAIVMDVERHIYVTTDDDHTQYLNSTRHADPALHQFGAGKAFGAGTTVPSNVGAVAAAGSGANPARDDHVHDIADAALDHFGLFGAAVIGAIGDVQALGGSASAGTATKFARADHVHDVDDGTIPTAKLAFTAGDHLGISVLTYAQISALSGADLWEGRKVYQTDTGTGREVQGEYTYNGVAWRLPWNLPWGKLPNGLIQKTSGMTTGIGSEVDMAFGFSLTNTLVAHRLMRAKVQCGYQQNGTGDNTTVFLISDGSNSHRVASNSIASGETARMEGCYEWTSVAGALTITPRATSSPGTTDLVAASVSPASLTWDDCGPAGSPA